MASYFPPAHHERRAPREQAERYDSRYHYPQALAPESKRHAQPSRSPARRRNSWPPPAFAEDEVTSLRREAGFQRLSRELGKSEVPLRGSIDQEPLILEIPRTAKYNDRKSATPDSDRHSTSTGIPTPPTSEDERQRKARRKTSRLSVNTAEKVPELSTRTASPYAFAQPSSASRETLPNKSRGDLTPPPVESYARAGGRHATNPVISSTRRDSARFSPALRRGINDSLDRRDDHAIDDSELPRTHSTRSDKQQSKTSSASSSRTSVVDFATPPMESLQARRLNLDSRRSTDTLSSLPKLNTEKSRRHDASATTTAASILGGVQISSPTSSASLRPNSAGGHPRSRESSYASSYSGTIGAKAGQQSHSPRWSSDLSREGSAANSRPGSISGSRPSSPSPRAFDSPQLPKDIDWNTLFPADVSHRPKPPSRLASSALLDQGIKSDRRGVTSRISSRPAAALPYPEDTSVLHASATMPSERDHYFNGAYQSSLAPPISAPRKPFMPPPSPTLSTARPVLVRGHSAACVSPTETRLPEGRTRHRQITFGSVASTSQARQELATLRNRLLPPCSRPDPVAGHDDWYTVIGASNLDFCPDCVGAIFERTLFRPSLRRAPPRSLNTKVRCVFGSPWMRIAWLFSLQQDRTDLVLLKDLMDIEDSVPERDQCPEDADSAQRWYGLKDHEGYPVRNFRVCYADVRRIERLLPKLSGLFVLLRDRSSCDGLHKCALRSGGNRFNTFLDALTETHEKTTASRTGTVDPTPLISLIKRKSRLQECRRDDMLKGALWHFAPSNPAFTVCEDCFDHMIEPEIQKGSDVASKFYRTLQPVYGEGVGSSCQLYSWRMRKAFRHAVERNDAKYLAAVTTARREAELRLQDEYKQSRRYWEHHQRERGLDEDDERRMKRGFERIREEWKREWE